MSNNILLETKKQQQEQYKVIQYADIEIDKIDDDLIDAREHERAEKKLKDEIHIKKLSKNISRLGLQQPIIITAKKDNNKRYSIVAGRFRLKACKRLNWKTIPCKIVDVSDKGVSTDITVSENTQRLNLDLDEKIYANILHFKVRGYKNKDIMHLSKKLHNFGSKDIPESFLDAMEVCDYGANYIYQIMQTEIFIPKNVQAIIKKEPKLKMDKRILLTHTKLRQHPKIMLRLAKEIRGLTQAQAKIKVYQAIHDLETGATKQIGNAYVFDEDKREKIDTKVMIDKNAAQHYLEITENILNLTYKLTGKKLSQGEIYYDPTHIDSSEKYRTEIVQQLTSTELAKLEQDSESLGEALSSLLDIIEQELKTRK